MFCHEVTYSTIKTATYCLAKVWNLILPSYISKQPQHCQDETQFLFHKLPFREHPDDGWGYLRFQNAFWLPSAPQTRLNALERRQGNQVGKGERIPVPNPTHPRSLYFVELCGTSRNFAELLGILRKFVEFCWNSHNFAEIRGIMWKFAEFCENSLNYVEIRGHLPKF